MERCNTCPLKDYCVNQKRAHDSCADMVSKYNAGLLLPPSILKNNLMQIGVKNAYYSNPDGMSVLMTYRILEDNESINCYHKYYDGSKITFSENENLKLIYSFLTNLGYEMSTEETEILNGTYELYDKEN